MIVISSAGSGLLDRIGASRWTFPSPGASAPRIRQNPGTELPTRVGFGQRNDRSAVYGDPRAKLSEGRVWSSPLFKDDTISALMTRNRGTHSIHLSDQWRGLGGALLTRFCNTGQDYTQTLVDEGIIASNDDLEVQSPAEQAQRAAAILARQTAELAGIATNAPTAGLKIQTRSGRSVELDISVNSGSYGVMGTKVELKGSGAMSPAERAAIGQLADGLDRALEGLGRDDAVGLDLSGLMGYDRGAIASVDLTASDSDPGQVLGTFSLHLGDDKLSIALDGRDGKLSLNVDAATPLGNTPAHHRRDAIQRTLDRMDRAAGRGHADAALVEQMKSAFAQLQTAATTDHGDGQDVKNGRRDPVAEHLSGLADFDASFGGETLRGNPSGTTNEAGEADYQLSQKTTTKDTGHGSRSAAQTVSEQLSADRRKAPGHAMLDVRTGNYSATRIRDSSTVTTLIEAAGERVTHLLRKTDEQRLETVTDFENHRVAHHRSSPSQRSVVERLR